MEVREKPLISNNHFENDVALFKKLLQELQGVKGVIREDKI